MLKRNVLIYLIVIACLGLECFIYDPFDYLAQLPKKDGNSYTTITKAGAYNRKLGLSPSRLGSGTGRFTLWNLDSLTLHIPREFINFLPHQPNGEVEALVLIFFLPDMESRKVLEKQFSYMSRKSFQEVAEALKVSVHLSAEAKYKACWVEEWFGPRFVLFQADCRSFQDNAVNKNDMCSLKDGHYDASLDLVVYKGRKLMMADEDEPVYVNEMYLSKEADPSNPDQWIMCTQDICKQHWFRDGLHVDTIFYKYVLPLHNIIRAKLNQKIDKFMNYTVCK